MGNCKLTLAEIKAAHKAKCWSAIVWGTKDRPGPEARIAKLRGCKFVIHEGRLRPKTTNDACLVVGAMEDLYKSIGFKTDDEWKEALLKNDAAFFKKRLRTLARRKYGE